MRIWDIFNPEIRNIQGSSLHVEVEAINLRFEWRGEVQFAFLVSQVPNVDPFHSLASSLFLKIKFHFFDESVHASIGVDYIKRIEVGKQEIPICYQRKQLKEAAHPYCFLLRDSIKGRILFSQVINNLTFEDNGLMVIERRVENKKIR